MGSQQNSSCVGPVPLSVIGCIFVFILLHYSYLISITIIMIIISPLINVLYDLLNLYKLALFIFILLGWLEAFNIINRYRGFVYSLHNFLQSITEPVLSLIRSIVPPINGWDLSPIILVFVIHFFQGILLEILKRLTY